MSSHRAPRRASRKAGRGVRSPLPPRSADPASRPEPATSRRASARVVSWPSWRILVPVVGLALALTLLVIPGRNVWNSEPNGLGDASAVSGEQVQVISRAGFRNGLKARRAEPQEAQQARAARLKLETERIRAERIAARIAARKAREAARRKRLARIARMQKSSTFRVGSLNILGSQHTRGPGGYGPGPERAAVSSGLITSRGVDVVGLQEVQDDQLPVLLNHLAGYSIWPQHALGSNGQRLQIAWRDSQFEMLDAGSVSYVFDSQTIPLPYVLLQDRSTKAQFWAITTHNSARGLEAQRDSGTAREIALINELRARNGKPVLIMGDVNEHEEFFYKVCQATGFLAANGGGAGCTLPPRPLRVDWIMGGGGAGVHFSGYVQDAGSLARASDHYFIHANVEVVDPGDS